MLIDKRKVKQAFSAAAPHYDGAAQLQREIGMALLQSEDWDKQHGTVLDIGCGTGFLTGELLARTACEEVVALDMALGMLQTTRAKLQDHPKLRYVCADAEALPLANGSIDNVFSNVALQWCNDLHAVFTDIKRVLKPGGQLAFATFGHGTLQELKTAWASVDDYRHVNDFYEEIQLCEILRQAGFGAIHSECQIHQRRYGSVLDLMKELKQLGAHNVLPGRNLHVTGKAALQRMMAAYPSDPVIATFSVIIIKAKL
jgi:malonyl-CoA O-methyltransferase